MKEAFIAAAFVVAAIITVHRMAAEPADERRAAPLGAEFVARRLGPVTENADLWELRIRHPGTDIPQLCYALLAGEPGSMAGVKPSLACL